MKETKQQKKENEGLRYERKHFTLHLKRTFTHVLLSCSFKDYIKDSFIYFLV
jgi:hypothetical protein